MKTVELTIRVTYTNEEGVLPPELWNWTQLMLALPGESAEVIDSKVIS